LSSDEIREWYFEVWNEPNCGFWTGSQQDYFHLLKVTSAAIKSVDSRIRVGGPATCQRHSKSKSTQFHFIESVGSVLNQFSFVFILFFFLSQWIVETLNFVKQNNVSLDFVSTHLYPTDFTPCMFDFFVHCSHFSLDDFK
jgi:xylan 1,4-beta-xylosidase